MNIGLRADRGTRKFGREFLPRPAAISIDLHFLLVIEDPNLRIALIALLKELGYIKVSQAEHGEMALRAIAKAKNAGAPISFVITDCAMPFMDGLSLIRTIRQDMEICDTPVLTISTQREEENILAAARAGADGYIVRPFNAASLGKKLEGILAARIPAESTRALP